MTTLLPLGSKSGSVFKVCYPIIRRSRRSHPARNIKRRGETGIRSILSFTIKVKNHLSGQG
jgi:hypothetical protein